MKLTELFDNVIAASALPSVEINLLTEHADHATTNALFVCIKGAVADGHDFAHKAYENGCRMFVAEKPLALPDDAQVFCVSDSRRTLAELACNFYRHPSRGMHLIGITGTKGKTTTAQLLTHILNQSGIPCGYIGTNGVSYADYQADTRNTTPDALTLQKTLADMCACGVKTAVIEVSSQALMQKRVDGTHFETVLFTNLTPDHIGPREHASFEDYAACKRRLFTDFGATQAICNRDDPETPSFLECTSAARQILCSQTDTTADFYAINVSLFKQKATLGVTFSLCEQNAPAKAVLLPLIGRVNVANALLALATAIRIFHIPADLAIKAIKTATVSGRSELIALHGGASAVIDYAHTGESLSQLLSTLREYNPAKLIVLFGSIGERAQLRRSDLGRAAAKYADLAIITSDNPNFEDPSKIISEIEKAFADTDTPYISIPDRREAIQRAVKLLGVGDVLVLAGKGHEEYQLINGEKIPFCERAILMEATKRLIRF